MQQNIEFKKLKNESIINLFGNCVCASIDFTIPSTSVPSLLMSAFWYVWWLSGLTRMTCTLDHLNYYDMPHVGWTYMQIAKQDLDWLVGINLKR